MTNKKKIGLILGPLTFVLLQLIRFEGLDNEARSVMASTMWIAIWWVTEAIPIAATSLLPLVLFPVLGGIDMKTTTAAYFSPLVMLYFGGFIIALGIQKWNLHQRIALNIIRLIGTNGKMIILGFMVATAFLSMWISNTATTLMMLPIGLAIIVKIGDFHSGEHPGGKEQFSKSLMLSIAYAASIGGMATLIGTPTNAIFSAITLDLYGETVTFADWLTFGLPVSMLLLVFAWFYLTMIAFRTKLSDMRGAGEEIVRQLTLLGKMSYEERMITVVFGLTAIAWITRSFVLERIIPGIDDTVIAITGALALFVLPAKEKGKKLMDWETANKLPWGILILFGGGLAIASAFKGTGLAEWMGHQLSNLHHLHYGLLLLIIIISVNFFTEITSNVATASVLLPILASIAETIGLHPFGLMTGACLAASCAFMLPVATPPNAIVFGSGSLDMNDMIRAGFRMNLISAVVLFLSVYYLLPIIWKIDMMSFPF